MMCYKLKDIENLNCSIISFRKVVHISHKDTNPELTGCWLAPEMTVRKTMILPEIA